MRCQLEQNVCIAPEYYAEFARQVRRTCQCPKCEVLRADLNGTRSGPSLPSHALTIVESNHRADEPRYLPQRIEPNT